MEEESTKSMLPETSNDVSNLNIYQEKSTNRFNETNPFEMNNSVKRNERSLHADHTKTTLN